MKSNLTLFFALLFCKFNTYSQINLSPMGVGINKPAPVLGLDIKGGNGNNLKIDNGGEPSNGLSLLNNGNKWGTIETDATSKFFKIVSNKSNQNIAFYTRDTFKRMEIDSSGKLAFGGFIDPNHQITFTSPPENDYAFLSINNAPTLSKYNLVNSSTSTNAGISLSFNTRNGNISRPASIIKQMDGNWIFRNSDSNSKISFDINSIGTGTPEMVIESDGGVNIPSARIKLGGNTVAGSIRWTGTDFEGYNGTVWKSFTQNKSLDSFWIGVPGGSSCQVACPPGYANIPDINGKVCQAINGTYNIGTYGSLSGFFTCGQSNINNQYDLKNAKCHCVKY